MKFATALPDSHKPVATSMSATDFPELARLHLMAREGDVLCRQGFVSSERRGSRTIYKLRFRVNGQQRVRNLGSDRYRALAIQAELDMLQQDLRLRRKFSALNRMAKIRLRRTKHQLQPLLASRGFYFHGLAVRKRRDSKTKELFNSPHPFMEER